MSNADPQEKLQPYSLQSYSARRLGGKPLSESNLRYLRDVFNRIMDEASDCETTGGMFEPFGIVANYVLANRKIRAQVDDNPAED